MKNVFLAMGVAVILFTAQTVSADLKKTVAVFDFANDSGFQSEPQIAKDFTVQLQDSLIQSGKFNVLTRQDLDVVFAEQDLGDTGRMAQSGAAQKGKAIPAQILIKGRITEFQEDTSGGGQGVGVAGFTIGTKKATASVAVIIQLVDSTTGQIIDSQRVEGEARAGGLSLGYSGKFDLNSSNFKKTPLGKAIQMALDRAVVYIGEKIDKMPWKGKVITSKEGVIFINAGQNDGVAKEDVFQVVREGESLIDPDTGMDLGSETTKLGSIKVFETQDKFSKAELVDKNGIEILKGDLVLK